MPVGCPRPLAGAVIVGKSGPVVNFNEFYNTNCENQHVDRFVYYVPIYISLREKWHLMAFAAPANTQRSQALEAPPWL
jgi:hypothetical protein